MSLKEWGEFIDSFHTKAAAEAFIDESITAVSRMGFRVAENAFSIHPTFDNVKGKPWLFGVYLREDRIIRPPND